MEQRKSLKEVLKRLYSLLDWKQKRSFLLIVFIMILSAGLSQLTPKAIGWLTDDILGQSGLDFSGIIPLLLFILAVNVFNELIKIWRRIIVEDTATKTEKKARAMAILSLLRAPPVLFQKEYDGKHSRQAQPMPGGYCEAGKADFHGFCAGYFQQHCGGCCHFHHAARDFGAAHAAGYSHRNGHCSSANQNAKGHSGGALGDKGCHGRNGGGAFERH